MKIAFYTLGCKVNIYETESVWNLFEGKGYQRVDFNDEADVYVINTCTVTNKGDSKSRKYIRRAVRNNPSAVIVVMGCYSQISSDEVFSIEGVDIVIGIKNRNKLYDYVQEFLETRKPIKNIYNIMKETEYEIMEVEKFTENTRAFVKIQEGCNNFCTFCIIPWARGLIRSRPKKDVINQITTLVSNGYKEVVLTGIHTGGYGEELDNYNFHDLLVDILKIKGLKRLRISSIEASQIDDDIIALLSNNNVIANHLHIPLQSGSDKILLQMRRKYNKYEYYDKICKIRKVLPNIAITTDVIVGFPDETTEDFEEMYRFIEKVGFSEMHIFPYSKRSGTPAAKMSNQVNQATKTMRVNELLLLNNKLANKYSSVFLNKKLEFIVESYKDDFIYGYTSNYLKCEVLGNEEDIGQIMEISIEECNYPLNKAIKL